MAIYRGRQNYWVILIYRAINWFSDYRPRPKCTMTKELQSLQFSTGELTKMMFISLQNLRTTKCNSILTELFECWRIIRKVGRKWFELIKGNITFQWVCSEVRPDISCMNQLFVFYQFQSLFRILPCSPWHPSWNSGSKTSRVIIITKARKGGQQQWNLSRSSFSPHSLWPKLIFTSSPPGPRASCLMWEDDTSPSVAFVLQAPLLISWTLN